MKRYLLILTSTLVLFMVGISAVLASVTLPQTASPIANVHLELSKCTPFMGKQIGDSSPPSPLADLAMCYAKCNTDLMNTPRNPVYQREARWLACMEDCNRRFAPQCGSDSPDVTPIPQR